MKKRILLSLVGLLITAGLAIGGKEAKAATYYVSPGESIQAVIDNPGVIDGDKIIAAVGTYTGDGNRDIDFLGKAITVRSTDPNDPNIVAATIIDCNGTESNLHRGFYFQSGEGADSVLEGFTITNGCAYKGGGIYCRFSSSPTISKCIIRGNVSPSAPGFPGAFAQDGGGIYCSGSSPIIDNCQLLDNTATGNGGAIYSYDGNALVNNCVIKGNKTYCSGGAIANYKDNISIYNCVITGNSASFPGEPVFGSGGGIRCHRSTATISNCTLSGNSAAERGGGIYIFDESYATVSNTVVWGNNAPEGPEIAVSSGPFGPTSLIVSYSNVQGGYPSRGNIDADPCFVKSGQWVDVNDPNIIVEPNDPNAFWIDGDYHLKSKGWRWTEELIHDSHWYYDFTTSRCIDAGNPGSPLRDELMTVPDDPCNIWGENIRINMGAYGGTAEASMPPYDWTLLSDMTNDGTVDFVDFTYLAAIFTNQHDKLPADFDHDENVDYADLFLLTQDWLKQTSWHGQ